MAIKNMELLARQKGKQVPEHTPLKQFPSNPFQFFSFPKNCVALIRAESGFLPFP